MPSFTLLGQSLVSGVLVGGLYGLVALGLSLSWGLLRLVNLAHFAFAFLGAYLVYQMGTSWHLSPWWAVLLIVPLFFALGVVQHAIFLYFRVVELTSLLVTFGISVIIESALQWIWTADFRRFETPYASVSLKIGAMYVPVVELIGCIAAAGLAWATWAWLRWTYVGKALRATAEDPEIAVAFGVNQRFLSFLLSGVCAAYAGIAGAFIALISTLAPSQIWAWLGVVFAVVIIGRLGNPLGALIAGMLIGAAESVAMATFSPAWAPVVSFSALIVLLLWQPDWL
ncbi:MAG: branched-chain amino acid ABC transporter permease [Alphaproteobacteria bacterium]|nr:branched-chain amino acid ABC transporter permease [Alphaproteobacteria bacterium]